MNDAARFRRQLLRWYGQNARTLPWRKSNALWPVLVSEFMLQQTRVETVIPYFERFLARFPRSRRAGARVRIRSARRVERPRLLLASA